MDSFEMWTAANSTMDRLDAQTKDLWVAVKGSRANFSEIRQRVTKLFTEVSDHTRQKHKETSTQKKISKQANINIKHQAQAQA